MKESPTPKPFLPRVQLLVATIDYVPNVPIGISVLGSCRIEVEE